MGRIYKMVEIVKPVLGSLKKMTSTEIMEYDPFFGLNSKDEETIVSPLEKACNYYLSEKSFDYDVCLFNTVIYGVVFPYVTEKRKIDEYCKNKFQWKSDEELYAYKGDTMNSFNTPIIEFIRLFGDEHISPKVCELNLSGKNRGKFKVCESKREYNGWYDFILDNRKYFEEKIVPLNAMRYIKNCHSIGNYIPVPFDIPRGEFNRPRGLGSTKDFWDLCMYNIYKWYKEKDSEYLKNIVGKEENINLCIRWLNNEFPTWEKFVKENYLEPFCNSELIPIEFWKDHFTGNIMPTYINEFLQFFDNASLAIEKRSEKMASVVGIKIDRLGTELLWN